MTGRRYWALILAGITCSGLLVSGAPAESSPGKDPRRSLLVVAGGKAAYAQQDGYCLTMGTDSGFDTDECTSTSYDRTPHPRFRVAGRFQVVTCAGAPATRVEAAVLRDGRKGSRRLAGLTPRRLDRSGQCWRLRLPRRLDRATSLGFRITYGQQGTADFVIGIALPR